MAQLGWDLAGRWPPIVGISLILDVFDVKMLANKIHPEEYAWVENFACVEQARRLKHAIDHQHAPQQKRKM